MRKAWCLILRIHAGVPVPNRRTPAPVTMTMSGTQKSAAASPETNAPYRTHAEIPAGKSGTTHSVRASQKQRFAVGIQTGSIVLKGTVLTQVSAGV